MLRRILVCTVAVVAVSVALCAAVACGYVSLPFGLTVNFPGFSGDPVPDAQLAQRISLPPGFHINTFAGGIDNARMLRFTPAGDLLVSAPRQGKVFLLERDRNGDGVADGMRVLLADLNNPHGLALHDGFLYVAEGDAVLRVRFDAETGALQGAPQRIVTGLPSGGNHWTRSVAVGPDDTLYVSMGSDCNDCLEDDARRATIMRFDLDGSGGEIYASGLRNSVGFDWQPGTGDLYATDNGRDLLGDDFPPCELNKIVPGGFYGWPFAHGDRVPDPTLGKGHADRIAASIAPAHAFGAHVAPLGMTFYRRPSTAAPAAFPPQYDGVAFVAQHGSWNRSKKSGYQVVSLTFDAAGAISEAPFASGFMRDEKVSGRPVDVAEGPDGALYVSDDFTGSIYRIAYGAAATGSAAARPHATLGGDPLAGLDAAAVQAASARAAALWSASGCGNCHIKELADAAAYHSLEQLSARYTVDSLAAFLKSPQPPMPIFPFNDAQRRDLAIYLLATHG
jgi:glucose/arabinose dehydrogenase